MIDVFLLCYNQSQYVKQAAESVQIQNVGHKLYIVDDCSTDGSQDVIKTLPGIHIFHKHNIGICATLNQLLCESTSEYFAILSADDYWLHGHLETLLSEIGDNGVCYSDGMFITPDGTPIRRFTETHNKRGYVPQGNIHRDLADGNWINACATLIRRDVMDYVWYDERMIYEDWDMWLRLSEITTFKYVDKVTTHNRTGHESLSTQLRQRTPKAIYSDYLLASKVLQSDISDKARAYHALRVNQYLQNERML